MKVVFLPETLDGATEIKDGVLHLHPPTGGSPKYKPIEVQVGDGFADRTVIPNRADLERPDGRGRLTLVPEKDPADNRVLLLGGLPNEYRQFGTINSGDPDISAEIVAAEQGAGKFGYGTAVVAIFQPGDTLVSSLDDAYYYPPGGELKFGKWNDTVPPREEREAASTMTPAGALDELEVAGANYLRALLLKLAGKHAGVLSMATLATMGGVTAKFTNQWSNEELVRWNAEARRVLAQAESEIEAAQ